MRLIDADFVNSSLQELYEEAKANKKKTMALTFKKMQAILENVPTANPTCPECGTVLAGEVRERQETDTKTN